tara:strand:+ start:2699 stop:3598 length:900 start_codon:yes stop_codon:yes gene_type:complete
MDKNLKNNISKTINNDAFQEIQEVILEHDYREMNTLSQIMNNLYIKEASEMILKNIGKGKIIISTGFFEIIPKTIETDGPPGAFSIGNAIHDLGGEVIYLIEDHTKNFIDKKNNTIIFPNTSKEESLKFSEQIIETYNPSVLISIERCGITEKNRYLNISRQDISKFNAFIDILFDLHPNTIGIGDGGNEIGMGKLYDYISNSEKFIDEPTISKTKHLIVTTVSNWGGWGIAAALSLLSNKKLLETTEQATEIMQQQLDLGAVDGSNFKSELSVDGFNWEINKKILIKLHEILNKYLKL